MKIPKKVNHLSFLFLSLALMIFFAIVSGGCGGNGTLSNSSKETPEESYSVLDTEKYDSDEDGVPDILDFDDVDAVSYAKDDVIQNQKISVPSRHYLQRLRSLSSADSFVVDLTADTEYTVEISKGEAYDSPIGDNVPNVEIFNPQGNALTFLDTETSSSLSTDVIELSVYPPEEPYMVCYTFTPAVNGSYTIKLSNTSDGDAVDVDSKVTLFVYKELRNEDGEAGYYKRYAFEDEDGEKITLSVADIMALRKALIYIL